MAIMSLAVLLFLAAVVTARPQSGSLERRFPVPELGEVAVGEGPRPIHQLRPQELNELSIVPASLPVSSASFFGQAIPFEKPSEVSLDPTPVVQEVSGPSLDSRLEFGHDVSSSKVEFQPEVQPPQKDPRQGAGLIGQGFHQSRDRDAHVIRHDRLEPSADGVAGVSYETSNGITVVSRTSLDKNGFNVVEGSYSYVSVDGLPVHVRYIADRNGYRYTALGLPVGPEIPPHAQEQIERGKRLHEEAARRRAEQQKL